MTEQQRHTLGSCPLDCPDACSWVITTDASGVATKIRGNPDHPFTQGGLCKKVNPWLEYAADPARLLHPLRRVGPKGPGATFERISWSDALAEISERLLAARDEHGGESIWPYAGTGHMGWIQGAEGHPGGRVWNVLGASRHKLSICSASGHHGLRYTIGAPATLDAEDMATAGVIILWGSNPLITNQHLWPFVQQGQAAGAPVIVIDPARTRTAARADLHIAPRPGSDGALALGLCRALLDRGVADEHFLRERALGADDFIASLDEWTAERTIAECGLSRADFDALIDLLIDGLSVGQPLAIKLGMGMQRHAHGGQAARTVSCLPAFTGSYGMRGGGVLYSSGSAFELAAERRHRPELRSKPARRLAMTKLGHHLTALDDPPVKVLMMTGANPVVSNPQTDLVRKGLARTDLFTVVAELYETETTDYADIILPSAMQHEQFDVTESFSHLYLNWNEPAVAPPGECLPSTEIHRRLAAALAELDPAFANPLLQATDLELAADLIDNDHYRDAGITVERLRSEGFVRVPNTDRYSPVADQFPTPSGRFEFTSERAVDDGHGRLPRHLMQQEVARREGDYVLVARGSEWHINSVFAGTAKTQQRASAPHVAINANDAEREGFAVGDTVRIRNDRGSFVAEVEIDPNTRPGVLTTTQGWWRQGLNTTVREQDSDMGEGAVFHDNVVRIAHVAEETGHD